MGTLSDIGVNLIATAIAAVLGWSGRGLYARMRERMLNRAVRSFFGAPTHICIVHSAVHDPPPVDAWNYPATDMRAARKLVTLFERVGLKEGTHFSVSPDKDLVIDAALWANNIVLICGPAKNAVFKDLVSVLSTRYKLTVKPGATSRDDSNILTDTMTATSLSSSRQLAGPPGPIGHDYASIASLPNPRNASRRIVILAGIHGVGTVGATDFVADLKRLRSLEQKRVNGTISVAAKVEYLDADPHNPRRTPDLL
jgi:hypothetical protein